MKYYVDNMVSASGTGTSWSGAWKNFSNIDWSVVAPGDTIYVSGGSTSKAYNQTLNVGKGGTAGKPITITEGVDPGHDGKVVIDGQNSRVGVSINDKNWVTVSDLDVVNAPGAGFTVRSAEAGVVLEGNHVHAANLPSGNARGYDVRGSVGQDAVVVRGNGFTTPTNTSAQTDGIWSSDNDGVVFEKNKIVISNSNTNGHSDGIQSFHDYSITIRDNWFEQANNATINNHGAWLSNTRNGGTIDFLDNVVLAPNLTGDSAVTHWAESTWGENGTADIVNNTIVGGRRALNFENSPDVEIYNNIAQPVSGGVAVYSAAGAPSAAHVDNNLLWSPNGAVANIGGGNMTWSQWKGRGYDAQGVNANPAFANPGAKDYTLQGTSPAINRGDTRLEVGPDQLGTARPQGAAYDLGAFEKAGAAPAPTPTPPSPGSLTGTPGADTITGTAGNDRITGGGGKDRLSGADSGADVFVYTAISDAGDTILDFRPSTGDKLDLTALVGAHGDNFLQLQAAGYVVLHQIQGAVRVLVSADGTGDNYAAVATLNGATVAGIGSDFLIA